MILRCVALSKVLKLLQSAPWIFPIRYHELQPAQVLGVAHMAHNKANVPPCRPGRRVGKPARATSLQAPTLVLGTTSCGLEDIDTRDEKIKSWYGI